MWALLSFLAGGQFFFVQTYSTHNVSFLIALKASLFDHKWHHLICRLTSLIQSFTIRTFFLFFGASSHFNLLCVCLLIVCLCLYNSSGSKGSEAQARLFSTEFSPEGTRAITQNSLALIGCIQLLYRKLSYFCRPQVPITLHLPFSSHCFATHTSTCSDTDNRTAAPSL